MTEEARATTGSEPGVWSSADIHIHTVHSDGIASPRDVLEWVSARTDLTVIAITDHNSVEGALEAAAIADEFPVEVIIGQEVDSAQGHILGLWTPERIPVGLSAADTVDAIHAQDGLAIAAHPFAPKWWARHGLCRGDASVYDHVAFDGFETASGMPLLFEANLRARLYWRLHRRRFARTGGSDAHILPAIGSCRTLFPGTTAEDLRRALLERLTITRGPGIPLVRNLRYAHRLGEIIERDRERRALHDTHR